MSKKIFKSIWIVALIVFIASLLLIMGSSYSYFSKHQMKNLKEETHLAARGIEISGRGYLNDFEPKGYRITWVDASGKVLFDSEADPANMGNHGGRTEIKEALKKGYGESVRYSKTLAEKRIYVARRMRDGSVVRLSIMQLTALSLLLGFSQPIIFVVLIALLLSFFLASRLTRRIVQPINAIDLDDPMKYYKQEGFEEISPLLFKISHQQDQLRNDKEEIERASLIRQEFTANVSHELKTPIHAISGYAELLENGLVKSEDMKPFIGRIRAESGRLGKLIEDIIELTKLDEGGVAMEWEDCDLLRIAENAVDSLTIEAENRNVSLSVERGTASCICDFDAGKLNGKTENFSAIYASGCDKDAVDLINQEPIMVRGVAYLLYSIVYNLCDNGIKYNHPGGKVKVVVSESKEGVLLCVFDTGVGIPEDCQDRIFERFFRVDKSRNKDCQEDSGTSVGGTGLGLSIVKHAVNIHRAKIKVESEAGKGTVFGVLFPVRLKQ